jgi:peptide/nickel transport system ATP-binding protein
MDRFMDMPAGTLSTATTNGSCQGASLLDVENLTVDFRISRRATVRAVSGLSFSIQEGETLGLVGESGCGKTSAARAIVGLLPLTSGRIVFNGKTISRGGRQKICPDIQMVFQNAVASLNPSRSVGKTIAEPLRGSERGNRRNRFRLAARSMKAVGIEPSDAFHRRPFEFSGGQCQRFSIARALITSPRLLVCDEPVSSLDVSVQAQILNLLRRLRRRYGLTMLFISHDLGVIKNISHRVAVMFKGALCEVASSGHFYNSPMHPYSAALLAAVPDPDADNRVAVSIQAATCNPQLPTPPSGCPYHERCPVAGPLCDKQAPVLQQIAAHRQVACHYPLTQI